MFDFEKLEVYQKAKAFNKINHQYILQAKSLDKTTKINYEEPHSVLC